MFSEAPQLTPRRRGTAGHAILEFALIAPWFLFLGVGALDWGFYAHALISAENAARSAALYTSSTSASAGDSATACAVVLAQFRQYPNIGTAVTTCDALPLVVSADPVTGPDNAAASRVTVTYQTVPLIPIPGMLSGRLTITRFAELKV